MAIGAQELDFAQFTTKLKTKTGIDLSLYKENQMRRRLTSLKDGKGYKTFLDFYQAICLDKQLYEEFLDHMTINVSEFYRNARRWEVLEQKIVPDILSRGGRIKCWSAACSTGDEPYSMVMMLSNLLKRQDIQVLATDIDQGAIKKAKDGVYSAQSVKEVPKSVLSQHFTMNGPLYSVNEDIKKCVTFKQHNLLADPYEQNFDLIVCRNVLIYFTDEAKDEIFRKFSKSLRKGGYLFIGGTEQIFQPSLYGLDSTDTFFYRKQ
jgi:chemotaxis protein methyltransferase CheR